MKRDAKYAEAAEKLNVTKDILAGRETRTKKAIIQEAFPAAKPAPKREATAWKPVVAAFKRLPFEDMKKAMEAIDKIYQAL